MRGVYAIFVTSHSLSLGIRATTTCAVSRLLALFRQQSRPAVLPSGSDLERKVEERRRQCAQLSVQRPNRASISSGVLCVIVSIGVDVCCRFAKPVCTFDVVLVATDKHNLRQRLRRGRARGCGAEMFSFSSVDVVEEGTCVNECGGAAGLVIGSRSRIRSVATGVGKT